MSEEKFTQGKWVVKDKSELGKNETNNIVIMESKKKNRYNAVPYACIGGFPDENAKEEIEANAYLIAAAPQMYRMLSILKEINAPQEYFTDDELDALAAVDHLLAKALGDHEP